MGLGFFLGWLRAKWFDLYRFPLSTCTDSLGDPDRRRTNRHEDHTLDGYVTLEVCALSFLRTFHQVAWRRRSLASACPPLGAVFFVCVCVCVCVCVFIKLHITTQSGPVILVILCHSH